jgi:hypothetical protein
MGEKNTGKKKEKKEYGKIVRKKSTKKKVRENTGKKVREKVMCLPDRASSGQVCARYHFR